MDWQPGERVWLPVRSNPRYEVSNDAKVRKIGGAEIGQWLNDAGYWYVRLSRPRRMARVHRLVAEAFIPNPDGKPHVNHLNHDRADSRVGNLEWCTQRENLAHADRHGRMCRNYWTGKRSPRAALSNEQAAEVRALYAAGGTSLSKLGARFGVSKRVIGRCVNRETYADV